MTPLQFLEALFAELQGYIEVRLIEDRRGGQVVERLWYSSPEALAADLPRLNEVAERHQAAVFFGVLPRKAEGSGKSEDALAARVVWVDLDFKDFSGGMPAARAGLAAFPVKPSITIRSGHGLHLYWLLKEEEDPETLAKLSRDLAGALQGDHCFDAARILRLPGTYNRKDPDEPILVEIATWNPDHQMNPIEIEEALDLFGAPPPQGDSARSFSDRVPPRVLTLLDNSRVRSLYCGHGKPAIGENGKPLDTTSSGYDYSLLVELVHRGIRDPDDLATTLACRPDGAARAKGAAYIKRTVARVLKRLKEAEEARSEARAAQADFVVERIRMFRSNPATYELTIDGKLLVFTSGQLCSKKTFTTAFMDALGRMPILPPNGPFWRGLVNDWLARAEAVEMPPDASDETALTADIERAISQFPEGEEADDLDQRRTLTLENGRVAFKTGPLLKVLKDDYPSLSRPNLCRILRNLSYEASVFKIQDKSVRAWTAMPNTRTGEFEEGRNSPEK